MVMWADSACGMHAIASVTSEDACERSLSDGRGYATILEDGFRLYPEGVAIRLRDPASARELEHGDVLEVFPDGRIIVLYAARSDDNALVVTERCNSGCVMCPNSIHERSTGDFGNLARLLRIIDHLPTDARHMVITGGEPTLIGEGFFEIMRALNEHLPDAQLLYLSNARAFADPVYAQRFRELATNQTRIAVPLHAGNAKLHDAITRSAGSFDQTVSALRSIQHSKAEIEIRVVVSRLNADALVETARLILQVHRRITCVNFVGLEMCGNAARNMDAVWIDYRDAFRALKPAADMLILGGIDVGLYNFPLCAVDRAYYGIAARSISGYKVRYAPECGECTLQPVCGGIFASTLGTRCFHPKPVAGGNTR